MIETPPVEKKNQNLVQKVLQRLRKQEGEEKKASQEKQVNKSGMSRREFLKRAGTIGLAAFLETQTGLFGDMFLQNIDKFFRDSGITKEGNPVQFIAVLEDLLREFAKNPSQENLNLIGAWLKFNGAIHYGARANMELASQFTTHFLYGEGELDISEEFAHQVYSALNELSDEKKEQIGFGEELSEHEVTVFLLQHLLSNAALPPFAFHPDDQSGPFALEQDSSDFTYFVGKPTEELIGRKIKLFAVAYSISPRIMNSMGQFTVIAEGEVVSVSDSTINLTNVSLQVKDRYDWSKNVEFGASTTVASLIEEMGIEKLFEHEAFDDLKSQELEIMDWEGKLLVDKGFAHNFDIVGKFETLGELEFNINDLIQPTDEYIQESGATVVELS